MDKTSQIQILFAQSFGTREASKFKSFYKRECFIESLIRFVANFKIESKILISKALIFQKKKLIKKDEKNLY
jgi:hypothetical protein